MKRTITLWALCVLGAVSCVTEPALEPEPQTAEFEKSAVSKFSIPVEQALDEMYSVIDLAYGAQTRAGGGFQVKSIETVDGRRLLPETRSGGSGVDVGDVLYVVNFENNAGFSILAADSRLEPVIAITESGSFSVEDLYEVSTIQRALTLEDLYCAEDDDYYLGFTGNIDRGGGIYIIGGGGDGRTGSGANGPFDATVPGLIDNYVKNALTESQSEAVELPPSWPYTYTPWEVNPRYSVTPMLGTFGSRWHQDSPFNDYCPRGAFNPSGYHHPAGCVTIALAQIMAYNNFPEPNKMCPNITSTWTDLVNYDFTTPEADITYNDTTHTDIARIIAYMGEEIPVDYNFFMSGQTFATPAAARRFLENMGYKHTNKYNGYREDIIMEMLRTDRPVFIGAISGMVGGHAWVIDGALQRKREKVYYTGTDLLSVVEYSRQLLHCNWGWGGTFNGYYASGILEKNGKWKSEVFDLTDGPDETEPDVDPTTPGTDDSKFNKHFRIVTYKKP